MNARRERPRHEYINGINPVAEALEGRRTLHRLWYRTGRESSGRIQRLAEQARARGIELRPAEANKLDSLAEHGNHQGVVLEAGPYRYVELDEILERASGRPVVVLDRVQDPQNLATLIRTAAAVDVAGIVIQTDRSASVTPAVVRSSAGLVEHLPVAREANTRRALQRMKDAGYWAIALESTEEASEIFTADIPLPAALVVGSEARGISPTVLRDCDLAVKLPMPGRAESLNAAVAGSVALFELLRRRQWDGKTTGGVRTDDCAPD